MRTLVLLVALTACGRIQIYDTDETEDDPNTEVDPDSDSDTQAGAETPVVDGAIGESEWAGSAAASASVETTWSGNELDTLRATIAEERLVVAVEGRVESLNAIVVYVDVDPGATGEGIADPSSLSDADGDLDVAMSVDITDPDTFRADLAWGTRALSYTASGFDARQGWRELDPAQPGNLLWVDAALAPSVCGAAACEASIPLPASAGSEVRLYARLVSGDGSGVSNQTLPADNADAPAAVTAVLSVSR